MEVWVVLGGAINDIVKIFSTQELAENYIKTVENVYGYSCEYIESYTVDEET